MATEILQEALQEFIDKAKALNPANPARELRKLAEQLRLSPSLIIAAGYPTEACAPIVRDHLLAAAARIDAEKVQP